MAAQPDQVSVSGQWRITMDSAPLVAHRIDIEQNGSELIAGLHVIEEGMVLVIPKRGSGVLRDRELTLDFGDSIASGLEIRASLSSPSSLEGRWQTSEKKGSLSAQRLDQESDARVQQSSSSFSGKSGMEANLSKSSGGSNIPGSAQGVGSADQSIEISLTMRTIREELGSRNVTALQIARALQRAHPEYGSGMLRYLELEDPTERRPQAYPWKDWEVSVRSQFRVPKENSNPALITGRLFLAALTVFDSDLRRILQNGDFWFQLLGELESDLVDPTRELSGVLSRTRLRSDFDNDHLRGEDQLGFEGDVNAVCEVIADPDVVPPLAIGLFGDWGAGKSFFMNLMRRRVHQLGAKRSGPGSLQRVVQIRFNAWHYADTSLWASLAVEIFERLADPEPIDEAEYESWLLGQGDQGKSERRAVIEQLETFRAARTELDQELKTLEEERRRLKGKLDEAHGELRKTNENVLSPVMQLVSQNEAVKAAMKGVSEKLGVPPLVEELSALGTELRTISGHATSVWRVLGQPGRAVTALAAFISLGSICLASIVATDPWSLSSGAGALVSGAGAASAFAYGLVRQILPAVRQVREGLERVDEATILASEARLKAIEQNRKQELEQQATLEGIERAIQMRAHSIAEIEAQMATIKAKKEALSVGRGLYDFLADRALGYRQHQGIVGMLHRDFRSLDARLRAVRASGEDTGLPRIDRVVLYIDDLDRCPPSKVVEVLEAVHLLLALELFVVVVGVDPRWLDRSLRHKYGSLGESAPKGEGDQYLEIMPAEYLEKIFQIPLQVPGMESKAYARLISSLAPSVLPTGDPTPPTNPTDTAHMAPQEEPTLLPVQPGSAAHGEGGGSMPLTDKEVQFAQTLGGLVKSPRAAKRLMNTYRLLRSTQNMVSSSFLGTQDTPGEYQAVLTLLAVAAGFPRSAGELLESLAASEAATWGQFLEVRQEEAGKDTEGQALLDAIAAATGPASGQSLEAYVKWGPTVARFSFTIQARHNAEGRR